MRWNLQPTPRCRAAASQKDRQAAAADPVAGHAGGSPILILLPLTGLTLGGNKSIGILAFH